MTVSKLTREDAQEWLASLQQVGEGWYRQVALAVRAGAHKSLGMERREFAQAIGQRMIDPREAIIELFREGHPRQAIADILGVSESRTVSRILAEEGLIEWVPSVAEKARETGYEAPAIAQTAVADGGSAEEITVADGDELREEIDRLAVQLKGAEAKRKNEVKELKTKIQQYQRELTEQARAARERAKEELTDKERERARKEADAWAAEQGREIISKLAHLVVANVVSSLHEATNGIHTLIDQDAATADVLNQIDTALAGLNEELNVARMSVRLK